VWFDAPIGYISITACAGDEMGFDWKYWWQRPDEVELYQFIGKDNIPFHTVIFPSSLLGSGKEWTMLHHMSSSEYLNYESGKFSKSKGVGVFGTDAVESGIPADVWRFYIFYNRPERGDTTFTWADFQEKVNGELIGNLGNLANRTLTFVTRYFGGTVPVPPVAPSDEAFSSKVRDIERRATDHLERAELRDAFRAAFELSDLANKRFQEGEPWKTRTSDPEAAAALIGELCYVLRDLAVMIHPFLPASASRLSSFFGKTIGPGGLTWSDIGVAGGLASVRAPEVLFAKLEDELVTELRDRYSGTQRERSDRDASPLAEAQAADTASTAKAAPAPKPFPLAELAVEERFERLIDLRVAKIVKIERHPKADKLYIETLDDGSGSQRVIVSGLVPFYSEGELLGKSIVLVNNLKPAKLRGIESAGMLLAASRMVVGKDGSSVKEAVEVLDAGDAAVGTRLALEGGAGFGALEAPGEIDVDTFFSVAIKAAGGFARIGERRLVTPAGPIALSKVPDGEIG